MPSPSPNLEAAQSAMTVTLFDAHCHLQDPRFEGGLEGVLARAEAAGVERMVCCGTREADWPTILELAARQPAIVPMLGLHPWYVGGARSGWEERLRKAAQSRTVGIGECGLDFALADCDREVQEGIFRAQLRLARELDRPVAMHCRKAWERLLAILGEEGLPAAGGLVHAYSGSAETARQLQGLGLHLSFGGSITFPAHAKAHKALLAVATEHLLLETDAPDLTPQGAAGLNEPAHLPLIAEAAARIRGEGLAALSGQTHANAMMLFGGLLW